jgi:ribosome maturation factor RimP
MVLEFTLIGIIKSHPKRKVKISKEVKTIRNKRDSLRIKINSLEAKIVKLIEHLELIGKDRKELEVNKLYNTEKDILTFLFNYYFEYCNLYIDLFLLEIIEDLKNKDISKIDIKRLIKTITVEVYNEISNIIKECVVNDDIILQNNTNKIIEIKANKEQKIENLKIKLISDQANELLADMSPVNENYKLEILKNEFNYEEEKNKIDLIDEQYNKFINEYKAINEIK